MVRQKEGIVALAAALRTLKMPVVAAFGNHDYYQDAAFIRAHLEAVGITVYLSPPLKKKKEKKKEKEKKKIKEDKKGKKKLKR